jgi:uncharacterized membrane protein
VSDSHWEAHPAVPTGDDRTEGERAADIVRNGMGSWPFVAAFIAFMAMWVGLQFVAHFDPYPYVFLNLLLSTLAGMQGAILLIAAKRADRISALVAIHTSDNTDRLVQLLEQNTRLLEQNTELTTQVHALAHRLKPTGGLK